MATVDRTGEPKSLLASLDAQTHRDFELIVVDQNHDDRLVPLLKPYRDKFPIIHTAEQRRGLSKARNIGMEYASGDIIAFPDDDCFYPPDLLRKVDQIFVEHPGIGCLTGRLIDDVGRNAMGRFDSRAGLIERRNVWVRGIEATTFVRKSFVKDIRFDESLGLESGTPWTGGEGTDYLLRLMASGTTLYYDPKITVVHPPFASLPDAKARRKAYSYGCGMGRVLRKHETPLHLMAKWLIRPLGGSVISMMRLEPARAWVHYNTFKGRLRGML
jgi:glycosyltransferase involved in cell wall biosynthesis